MVGVLSQEIMPEVEARSLSFATRRHAGKPGRLWTDLVTLYGGILVLL